MSYILDALRRADAERERDPARGIHAQPAAGAPATSRAQVPGWAWPAGALVIVAAAVAVLWPRAAPQDTLAVPPVRPSPDAIVPVAASPVAAAPIAPVPVATLAPARVSVAAAVSPPAPAPVPVPHPRPVAVPHAAPALPATGALASAKLAAAAPAQARVATPAMPSATGAPVPATATASANPADRVYNVAELPAEVVAALPKLAISGGVYSDNAAQRMVIVGGQVANEGAQVAPGLVVDQIHAHGVILKFRGYRYRVAY